MTRKNRIVAGALLAFGALMVFQTQPALGDSTSDPRSSPRSLSPRAVSVPSAEGGFRRRR